MPPLNTSDRKALHASLDHWRRELAHAQVALTGPQRFREAAAKAEQMARSMIERRSTQLRNLPGPRHDAVHFALGQVGITEHPPGSNRGLIVDHYQGMFHISGQPWCGAFVGYCANQSTAKLTERVVYTPYIFEDARRKVRGLDGVVWAGGFSHEHVAHSGDLVLYDFGTPGGIKHVGMLVAPWKGSGPLQTVEGNTSFGSGGSQDNGGAVARRSRDISLVHSIVAIKW